ncbi:MAG: lipoyl synthase [Bradymonadia bacterium]
MSDLVSIDDPRAKDSGPAPDPRVRAREPGPRPPWLKVRYQRGSKFAEVLELKEGKRLNTVCEEARCPNIDECWTHGTATFMLMGEICTRRCGFCAVGKGPTQALDAEEPVHTAEAIKALGVKHAVITSVNRDDLPDGGAQHFADTVRAIHRISPGTRIELLVPDFQGNFDALDIVLAAQPDIVAHNTETVPRLYRRVRPQADYQQSLDVLEHIGKWRGPNGERIISKTGVMMGLGEFDDEIEEVMADLRAVDCKVLTLGQYLSPTVKHLPVDRWVTPQTFDRLREVGLALGFDHVESGPLVRSSYMAHRHVD